MKPVVALVAPGNMGAGLAGRLVDHGLEVRTLLEGRSEASRRRAAEAGMTGVSEAALVEADLLLSVVPPNEALPLAERLAPALAAAARKPVFVDCNAVNPGTVERIAAALSASGCAFVDGSIIGLPPKREDAGPGPTLYLSGAEAAQVLALRDHGLDARDLEAPLGAASALKMCYALITKGLTALAATSILAAGRHGAAEALRRELGDSQAQLLARFSRSIPDMVPKAYRWEPEMREIAAFLAEGDAARGEAAAFEGIARLYGRLAAPEGGAEIAALRQFFESEG